MIRLTIPEDTPELIRVAETTGVFNPHDIQALREVLDDYHAFEQKGGHRSITWEEDGKVLGFAYYAPAEMTDRTWYLWWIAVRKDLQAQGVGGKLLRHAEEDIARNQGRIIFLETSSLSSYDLTRRFYLKYHYHEAAVLHDYYADDHHMVVYAKRVG